MIDGKKLTALLSAPATEVFRCASSTNALLKERAKTGAPAWSVIAADSQTEGRGRKDRSFFSPDGGLYMSVLLPEGENTDLATVAAAVVASEAAENFCGQKIEIKWVNDLYCRGKKVCGILAEGVFDGSKQLTVLGIGINIVPPVGGFPKELPNAGALLETRNKTSVEELAAAIYHGLKSTYENFDRQKVLEKYRERSLVLGRKIEVPKSGGEWETATAVRIEDNGNLTVRYGDGREETLFSGEISVRI